VIESKQKITKSNEEADEQVGEGTRESKVQKLLKDQRSTAFESNMKDINRVYNLDIVPVDEVAQQFQNRLQAVREEQKSIIPLFMESMYLVNKHRDCLNALDDPALNDQVPRQLLHTFKKGQTGIVGYSSLLESINTILKRNAKLEHQLVQAHKNLKNVSKKAQLTVLNVKSLEDGSDPTKNAELADRYEKSKDRLKGLLNNIAK